MLKLSKAVRSMIAAGFILATGLMSGCGGSDTASTSSKQELLNVSYDPTRELYAAILKRRKHGRVLS